MLFLNGIAHPNTSKYKLYLLFPKAMGYKSTLQKDMHSPLGSNLVNYSGSLVSFLKLMENEDN